MHVSTCKLILPMFHDHYRFFGTFWEVRLVMVTVCFSEVESALGFNGCLGGNGIITTSSNLQLHSNWRKNHQKTSTGNGVLTWANGFFCHSMGVLTLTSNTLIYFFHFPWCFRVSESRRLVQNPNSQGWWWYPDPHNSCQKHIYLALQGVALFCWPLVGTHPKLHPKNNGWCFFPWFFTCLNHILPLNFFPSPPKLEAVRISQPSHRMSRNLESVGNIKSWSGRWVGKTVSWWKVLEGFFWKGRLYLNRREKKRKCILVYIPRTKP